MEIGGEVRVTSGDGLQSRRATISYYDIELDSVDVIYKRYGGEENDISSDRVHSLMSAELDSSPKSAMECKELGNQLFKLKDYYEAYEFYVRGINELQVDLAGQLGIGSNVIVTLPNRTNEYSLGMVCDVEDAHLEIVYSTGEEEHVRRDRVVLHCTRDKDVRELLAALLLNSCKSCFKLNRLGWAVRYASLVVLISRDTLDSTSDLKERQKEIDLCVKQLLQSLEVRCSVFIRMNRFQLAVKDSLLAAEYPAGQTLSQSLQKEILKKKNSTKRENKILARNIAEWIDVAMASQQDSAVELEDV